MSKIDWINWKTSKKEIINPKEIDEKIKECFLNYNTYMNPVVYEQIKYEVNAGGLSKDAFNIMNISPANEMAIDILNRINEIKQIMKNLSLDIKETTEEQKQIEKEQLISEIKKKIEKEKKVIESIKTKQDLQTHIIEMGENPEDIIAIINDRITKLKERLDEAESI